MNHLAIVAFALVAYSYVGYPLLVALYAGIRRRTVRARNWQPSITVIVSAYNEEKAILAKLHNLLLTEYPLERIEILVVSDGSTDATDEIVKGCGLPNVALLRVEGRRGKTAAQNAAARTARGEILVFTDATTELAADALTELVRPLADESIGCAAGALVYKTVGRSVTGRGGVKYWAYERALRLLESRAEGLIGLSGCLYAVRASSYRELDPNLISDFVVVLDARKRGLRTVFVESARCWEETLERSGAELKMRERVVLRSLTALWSYRGLLNPLRHGFFAIQLFSHKLLRYLMPVLLLVICCLALLQPDAGLNGVLLLLVAAGLLMAGVGHLLARAGSGGGPLVMPYYFFLANVAAVLAIVRFLRGHQIVTWTPER